MHSVAVGSVCLAGTAAVVYLWPDVEAPATVVVATEGDTIDEMPPIATEERGEGQPTPPEVPTLAELDYVCGNLWIDPSEECSLALKRRFGNEKMSPRWLINTPYDWQPGITDARGEWSLPGLREISWERAFEDPVETRRVAGEALSRPECIVGRGRLRPQLDERCAADEMAKLGVLHMACVGLMVRDDAWRELGMAGKYEEDWRSEEEGLVETANDQDSYWRAKQELMEERFRFAWRVHRCREVPKEALVWVDAFPTPDHHSGAHQGVDLLEAAGRIGHRGAALWSFHRPEDLAVVERWDRALASLVRSETEEAHRLEHLIAAVELAYLDDKPWHEGLVGRLRQRYTREEILTGLLSVPDVYPGLEPHVVESLVGLGNGEI